MTGVSAWSAALMLDTRVRCPVWKGNNAAVCEVLMAGSKFITNPPRTPSAMKPYRGRSNNAVVWSGTLVSVVNNNVEVPNKPVSKANNGWMVESNTIRPRRPDNKKIITPLPVVASHTPVNPTRTYQVRGLMAAYEAGSAHASKGVRRMVRRIASTLARTAITTASYPLPWSNNLWAGITASAVSELAAPR
tara:strand:+ start:362 stop:934 length:573 start_codon:yes stop_codon:yes gene_type:complete